MRKIFQILVVLFLTQSSVLGQKMPTDFFDEGEKHVEAGNYNLAIIAFRHIVVDHPHNKLYPRALFNLGYCYYAGKQYDSSISIYRVILAANFDERENSGGGIMDDPYANYKHRASEMTSSAYYKKKMFDSSLFYFIMSDTTYPFLHFCGNAYDANAVHIALTYSDLYLKLGETHKAITSLLDAVFINASDNSEVLSRLGDMIKNKRHIKDTLDEALNHIYSKDLVDNGKIYKKYFFRFLDKEIVLPRKFQYDDVLFDKKQAISYIKSTPFYKMIEKIN